MTSTARVLNVGIVGTGNIGSDLMIKVERNPALRVAGMAGIDPNSDGLRLARERGHLVTDQGLAGLLELTTDIDLVFDATSAYAHIEHARLLAEHGIRSVDLTPAGLGPAVVPAVNLAEHGSAPEITLITCGAQATIPVVAAVSQLIDLPYAETVSTVSSRSAGPGTRANIDEFTASTARGLETIGGARQAKAIILLNPADPPILMRNTIYLQVGDLDLAQLEQVIAAVIADVAAYVPGYRLVTAPQIADGIATVMIEVEGAGDYLPPYAGNLDIMTAAAVRVAEAQAQSPLFARRDAKRDVP
jgi:acetaldehyde dehydrogenase (acetylating)